MASGADGGDDPELRRRAEAWIAVDPDPSTRAALTAALDDAEQDLAELMTGRLGFGTAGIRGPLGPGPNRMNVLVAEQTAAGLARTLIEDLGIRPSAAGTAAGTTARKSSGPSATVVVGHDARHGSSAMAAACVRVLVDHGLDVAAFDGPVPTPLVASTLATSSAGPGRHNVSPGTLRSPARAAIVVTASHNPAADNGIKVYWGDGAQIVAPIDARIAAAIDDVAADMSSGSRDALRTEDPPGTVIYLGTATAGIAVERYLDRALAARSSTGPDPTSTVAATVPVALTSLHGVGAEVLEALLRRAGHTDLRVVAAQREPDADFPTVAFPNPEEPGALDMVIDLASSTGCVAALANDPDADRVAVIVPAPDGSWRALTGDEVGALLCAHGLRRAAAIGVTDPLVVTTVVSSQQCGAIAAAAGAHFAETLTGFKWLCRPALAHPDWTQVLAYEEALGYAVGDARDKDGMTAALAVVDLVTELAADGRTLLDELDGLALAHGVHVTRNGWTPTTGGSPGAVDPLARLIERPPDRWGGRPVLHSDRPAPDVLRWWTDEGTRIALRPSGTEPKLKHYCEAVVPVGPSGDIAAARVLAAQQLDAVVADIARLTA